jgi:hypothetical protein
MRKMLVATATATILSAGALLAGRAEALTLAAPAGIRPAIEATSSVEQTRYVCYRTWRRGGYRQVCSWRPSSPSYRYGYGYGYRPYSYGGGYPYYYRPYAYAPWRRPGVGLYFRF